MIEKDGQSKDWVVWCRSRKIDEGQRPFEVENPKQERREIKKEAKDSQCLGNRGCDRTTSNAQGAKSMLRAGFTKIATWQTSKKQL